MHQSGLHEREQTGKTESSPQEHRDERERDIWKGLLSGLAGGLAGTLVMTQYQVNSGKLINRIRHHPQQPSGENTTTLVADKVTEAITGSSIPPERRNLAGNLVHYSFGMLMGGLYGVLNELVPATSTGHGLVYGAALWAVADEVALPASGLARWWPDYPIHVHANALGAHLVYAATLDAVSRGVHSLPGLRDRTVESESAYFRQPGGPSRQYGRVSMRRYSRFGQKGERRAA